ncbi:P-loop containing nucleoside triphosphate hydrolase protein [Lophiotrema nucula]|uniref:RNA helicase n=1 Tax=Lophiotrema nucula TaxID=690887 RepID=A0A6A5Z738_9PLEO|nr:P-loop containing nucleoside triphosphate hydrolase protein [Lophiotrema nucula]
MPKRKLNENDVPEVGFASFGLEPRLLRGIRDQKWTTPTAIQARAVPLALEGKDILARSGTGTGKTAAYAIPIVNSIIKRKERGISALVLVPTKELALQVSSVVQALAKHCGQECRVVNIAGKEKDVVQVAKLAEVPDVVVATPGRASALVAAGSLGLKSLRSLVVDEGDLVLGYGFQEDLERLAGVVPRGTQIFLMSATLSTELDSLKGLFARDPVLLNLDDVEEKALVKQYAIRSAEDEKFLLLYAMFVLKLLKGKTIIFVGDVDRSYRVKLFLEQFGIKSCVLNSELPLTSRLHIVEEFNKNIYDILITSDETEVLGTKEDGSRPPKKKSKASDKDSGVSRGLDFFNVANVLNFDLPPTYKSYFHRIGRTARAGKSGTALSFCIPKDKFRKHKPTSFAGCENDEVILKKIEKHQKDGQSIEAYNFDMKRLDPFRYRFADALRAVTRIAVREARVKELRSELLKSERLSRYFEENPAALQHLRHDQNLTHAARVQPHLKHVPDYLLPGGKLGGSGTGLNVGLEKERRDGVKKFRRKTGRKVVRGRNGKVDPLKTFNARGRGKK